MSEVLNLKCEVSCRKCSTASARARFDAHRYESVSQCAISFSGQLLGAGAGGKGLLFSASTPVSCLPPASPLSPRARAVPRDDVTKPRVLAGARSVQRAPTIAPPAAVPGGPEAHFAQAIEAAYLNIDAAYLIRRPINLSNYANRKQKIDATYRHLKTTGWKHDDACTMGRGKRRKSQPRGECAFCDRAREILDGVL